MRNKARKQQNSEVGYKRPPKQFQFKKGKSGNPSGKRDAAGRVPDLRMLLQLALNARVRHGGRQDLTHAAAGMQQLIAQFAAGDRMPGGTCFCWPKNSGASSPPIMRSRKW